MIDKIKVDEIYISGKKFKSCPFGLILGHPCYISNVKCRYGATEVRLPKNCPLRRRAVIIDFKWSVVKTDF